MQIILMHARCAKARTITLQTRHIVALLCLFLLVTLASSFAIAPLAARFQGGNDARSPSDQAEPANEIQKHERHMKENLDAMAAKLGEMQAQLMRLDALGERVQGLAGVKPQEFNFRELPGRGGPAHDKQSSLGMAEFQTLLDAMAREVEHRTDYMNVVETTLMAYKVKAGLLPTVQPVKVGYTASGFGWRLDPFSGRSSFHEGIDFPAPTGTPIHAAAGGVVIAAEYHHQFGNLLEIDHGNQIVTRYAHASRLLAKVGDIVRRGQHVADIGSTGRSTGSHLHFEVLVKGVHQDPNKFLAAGADQTRISALGVR